MTSFTEKLDQALCPGFGRNWDDQLFRERILQHSTPTTVVLNVSAGAGIVQQMSFWELAARVCGVDLDPRVVDNPLLDEGKVADANGIPYPDATFDVVFADNVLEHLPDPLAVFREIARVLKQEGIPVQDAQQNPLHAHHRSTHPAPFPSVRQPAARPSGSRHLPHPLPCQHVFRCTTSSRRQLSHGRTHRPHRRPSGIPAHDLAHLPARRGLRTTGQFVGWAGDVPGVVGGGAEERVR